MSLVDEKTGQSEHIDYYENHLHYKDSYLITEVSPSTGILVLSLRDIFQAIEKVKRFPLHSVALCRALSYNLFRLFEKFLTKTWVPNLIDRTWIKLTFCDALMLRSTTIWCLIFSSPQTNLAKRSL